VKQDFKQDETKCALPASFI